jgi:2-polyprenyl-3-methyl-5-hydroxy-6-metoxy-1,4-benzoquinol methylase
VTEPAPAPPASAWSLIDGFVGWSATVAALELGLFGALDRWPNGAAPVDLAAACAAQADRVETLCRALVGLGLLTSEEGRYRLGPAAEPLRRGSPGYLGDLLVLSPGRAANWLGLTAVVRGADPAAPVDGDLEGFHAPLARATFGLQRATAAGLPAALGLDPSRPVRVADVGAGGAGGGAWSVGLLEVLPEASAVLIDRPALLDVARVHAEGAGVAGRCTFVESELDPESIDDLAEQHGLFDVVVMAHVLRHLPPSVAGALVTAAAGGLGPQGVVVVADYIVDGDATTVRAATLDLVTLANARAWHLVTRADLTAWLQGAGLGLGEDLDISNVFSVLAGRRS